MFMLQSLEYASSVFDGIMLSGDNYIAHYLILIKPENSDIVIEKNVSPSAGLAPLLLHPIFKASRAVLAPSSDAYIISLLSRHNAFLGLLCPVCNLCKLSSGKT